MNEKTKVMYTIHKWHGWKTKEGFRNYFPLIQIWRENILTLISMSILDIT